MSFVRQNFVYYGRNKHSEKHAKVYGKIERAEEHAYEGRADDVTIAFDQLVHAERGDTRFYAAHADGDEY